MVKCKIESKLCLIWKFWFSRIFGQNCSNSDFLRFLRFFLSFADFLHNFSSEISQHSVRLYFGSRMLKNSQKLCDYEIQNLSTIQAKVGKMRGGGKNPYKVHPALHPDMKFLAEKHRVEKKICRKWKIFDLLRKFFETFTKI